MRFIQTKVEGAWVIEPTPHEDDRGHFFRAWCSKEFSDHRIQFQPVQANMGFNIRKGTVRGMHFQVEPALEAKLVRCTRGAMFDVVLDLRSDSKTCGKWYGVELTAHKARMLYLPRAVLTDIRLSRIVPRCII